MTTAFQTVLSTTVVMGILTLVFAGLSPVLGKRYHAKSLYGACIALMIGFLIPFRLFAPIPAITVHVPAFLSQAVTPQSMSGANDGSQGNEQVGMQTGAQDEAQADVQNGTQADAQGTVQADAQGTVQAGAQGAVQGILSQADVQAGGQGATQAVAQGTVQAGAQGAVQSILSQADVQANGQGATQAVAQGTVQAGAQGAVQSILSQADVQANGQGAARTAFPALTWQALLGFVWLAGAVLTLAVQLIRHMLFLRTVRRWQKPMTDEGTVSLFTREKQAMGIKARVQLLLCPSVNSPMMIGLLRPRLLLPDTDLTADELPLVFRHELTHLKRRDLWLKTAMLLARCVHWFNPAVYLLGRTFSFWQEASCDERVTCAATLEARQFYSETIIRIIRRQARLKTAVSTSFYGGRNGMRRRIVAIMEGGKRGGAFIGLVALVLTVGLSMAFAVAASPIPTDSHGDNAAAQTETYYVAREDASGVPLLSVPSVNDLNSPMIVYLNGTPVQVVDRVASSSLPEWNEPEDAVNWARVHIEGDGIYNGYDGWMPLHYLAPTAPNALPTATISTTAGTGHASLYLLNTDNSTVIDALPNGQNVTLLGIAERWYHVIAGSKAGFLHRDDLQLDGDAATLAAPYLNAHFDSMTREEQTDITTFSRLVAEKGEQYGTDDFTQWSLEDKAWYSELERAYYGSEVPYFQLPQEGDLQQDAAVNIAWQSFISYHATPDANQSDYTMNLSFCCEPANDGVSKEWEIGIKPKDGEKWFRIFIASPSGEIRQVTPMETEASTKMGADDAQQALAELEAVRGPYDLWSPEDKAAYSKRYGDGSLLVPDSSALSKAEATSIARKALVERGDATQADADAYQVGLEYQYAGEGERTWRVAFLDANGAFVTDVLLDAFTGEIIHSTVTGDAK